MTDVLVAFERLSPLMLWMSVTAAVTMAVAVVAERTGIGLHQAVNRRVTKRYRPLVQRALAGDDAARQELVGSPARHRLAIARLLIEPLIDDRHPERVASTRALAQSLSIPAIADRYLRSWFWWRRALALRALGLAQVRDRTPEVITALDDANPDVRAAALDALADMHDLRALQAIIVRVHDTSLHRGRRGAAIRSFGSECEPFLLEMSEIDPDNRLNYIHALAICGTARSRPRLCRWTDDTGAGVRATALEALAYVGLDDDAARVALENLESDDPQVRAMAAYALRGWQGSGNAPARLAAHLGDTWTVAVSAARTLQSMGTAGAAELQACASRQDTGGLLARQMLWQPKAEH